MDQSSSPQAHPSSTTENPVVALGRKVQSVLSTHQRPSVRILREPSRNEESRLVTEASQEKTNTNDSAGIVTRATNAFRPLFSRRESPNTNEHSEQEYDPDTVDLLDVVDPEVAALSTLTNVQNSLFVPNLGTVVDRRARYRLSDIQVGTGLLDKLKTSLKRISEKVKGSDEKKGEIKFQYAVLPDGETLQGWNKVDKEELDDLVRHMLHSRRAGFKRSMKGFWKYVHRPLGLFITTYATLITLFGAAWVLFLIGWISLGSKKDYVVNVVDNVLVALFAIIGDGLAPFRAVDTYHMAHIAHYHRKTWKKREKLGLPELVDHNDLPDQREEDVLHAEVDLESLVARKIPRGLARKIAPRIPHFAADKIVARHKIENPSFEYSVLTQEEQAKLEYHERKFSKSHTFYKPHETETHHAFPLRLLIAVVVLLDCHSALQITLGACTWGISYKKRPFALTTVILCFSITCNIMGGVLISIGDKRTRKKDVIERIMRQELTAEAIEEIEKREIKAAEERGEINPSVRKRMEEEKEEAENEEIKQAWKYVPSLPKHLLGKGKDHRQPSLPQKARKSGSGVASTTSSSSKTQKSKSESSSTAALQPVREGSEPSRLKKMLR